MLWKGVVWKGYAVTELKPAHQDQDQDDNQYEAESATAPMACAIERAAADAGKTAEQYNNENNQK